jgi:hypothetical protein
MAKGAVISPRHQRCRSHQSELRASRFLKLKQGAASLVFRIRRWENAPAIAHWTLLNIDDHVRGPRSDRLLARYIGDEGAGSIQGGPSAATKRHAWYLGPRIGPSALHDHHDSLENQRHAAEVPLLYREVMRGLWPSF